MANRPAAFPSPRRRKSPSRKRCLARLRVDRIEVASAGISEGEQEAVCSISDWARDSGLLDRVEILGFVDHKRSVDWIHGAGAQVLNLLTKGSEKHCRQQLRKDLDEHLKDIDRTVGICNGTRIERQRLSWRLV